MNVRDAGEIALAVGIIAMAAFVVVYWVTSRWERTSAGWHIMVSTGSVLVLLVVSLLDWPTIATVRPSGWVHVIAYAVVAVMGVWRLVLLLVARTRRPPTLRGKGLQDGH